MDASTLHDHSDDSTVYGVASRARILCSRTQGVSSRAPHPQLALQSRFELRVEAQPRVLDGVDFSLPLAKAKLVERNKVYVWSSMGPLLLTGVTWPYPSLKNTCESESFSLNGLGHACIQYLRVYFTSGSLGPEAGGRAHVRLETLSALRALLWSASGRPPECVPHVVACP